MSAYILTGEHWQHMAEFLIHFLSLRSRVHASGLLLQLLCLHCLHFLALWISLVISTSLVPLALGVVHLIRMRLLSYCSIVVCICSFQQSAANSLDHIRVYVKHSMNAGEILRAWYLVFPFHSIIFNRFVLGRHAKQCNTMVLWTYCELNNF